ncbi:hypothetical protein [Microbacterium album]|uniref:AbiEi antitoxin C-terminal domain-containing protein n=1 Tax=Microbacterium album TaxID=2053191 RepID=A0A917ML23_9MICO|nr:hypothetical protein [Microbacterium album]GGH35622.1 hypothetical protein GCM10010921_04150 [Microbacterium album]
MAIVRFGHEPLSPAELSAACLDGELVALGEGYAPSDALSTPWVRAASLRPLLRDGLVGIGLTAAWVHGGVGEPPAVHRVQRLAGRHLSRPVQSRVRYRDTPLAVSDAALLAGVRIATLVRTLVDLARESDEPASASAARRLASPVTLRDAHAWLDAHPRMPGSRAARCFLRELAEHAAGARTT